MRLIARVPTALAPRLGEATIGKGALGGVAGQLQGANVEVMWGASVVAQRRAREILAAWIDERP